VKRSLLAIVVSLSALLLLSGVASAADEPLSPEALSIANALNCPVCTGESVRDSSSQLAHDIRELIQQQLDQGMTRQQIMDYFVNAYGITILRQPPKNGFSLALWWIPVAALLAGGAILLGFVTQRRRHMANGATNGPVIHEDDPSLARYEALIRQDASDYESDYVDPPGAMKPRVEDLPNRGLAGSDQGVS
jgi:cytochrome c-type biogenesis protein CcmH